MDAQFRFQDLEIWRHAIQLTDRLFDIADQLEERHLYRFAEQVRGAALSMSNNISEGSGCVSRKEFARFLDIARRSMFECANMTIILARRNLIGEAVRRDLLNDLELACRKTMAFRHSLAR